MKIKSLTIYCSSSNNLDKNYYKVTKEIAEIISKFNLSIVYGGGNVGLMGELARTSSNLGTNIKGIIPKYGDSGATTQLLSIDRFE